MKKMSKLSLQSGFSLIELVTVIVIIGILSAVALSRYIDIQQQARSAKAQAIFGAVKTAANLAKAVCMLDISGASNTPTCTTTAGTANMTGVLIAMVNQYPAASAAGIIAAVQIDPTNDRVIITAGNPITIDVLGGTVPNCRVSYTAATTPNTFPVITLVTTGC